MSGVAGGRESCFRPFTLRRREEGGVGECTCARAWYGREVTCQVAGGEREIYETSPSCHLLLLSPPQTFCPNTYSVHADVRMFFLLRYFVFSVCHACPQLSFSWFLLLLFSALSIALQDDFVENQDLMVCVRSYNVEQTSTLEAT